MKIYGSAESVGAITAADWDSGWLMLIAQMTKLRHDLNTKDFRFMTLQGSDDKFGTFPTWAFSTSNYNYATGNIIQAVSPTEIVLARGFDGNFIVDPSINWSTCLPRYIRIKIWI